MQPGDIIYTQDEYWIVLVVCFTDEAGTHVLAVQQGAQSYSHPRYLVYQI